MSEMAFPKKKLLCSMRGETYMGNHTFTLKPIHPILSFSPAVSMLPRIIGKIIQDIRVWCSGGSQQVC